MKRRDLLKSAAAFPPFLLSLFGPAMGPVGTAAAAASKNKKPRRISDPPWDELQSRLGDRLKPVDWPLGDCIREPKGAACRAFFEAASNPYFLGDHPGLTQTLGWTGAWTSKPSERVVEAQSAGDVAAAVSFANRYGVPLVIKGGGHSYKGGSSGDFHGAGSLLIWTRRMNAISLYDEFVPAGSDDAPVPAVSVGAGAMWGDVYREVSVHGGRYVQGGGCLTVGVAGLIQSGGFGPFSKLYGLACASLLEAEVVTADGHIRTVNANREPDLFFALKGGGGGTFCVVTRLVLRTHDLPPFFGAVFMDIRASSEKAFRILVGKMLDFYAADLFNPHWGEQIRLRPDNTLSISMVFQGLTQREAEAVWAPFIDWVLSRPQDYRLVEDASILAMPARSFFDAGYLKTLPGIVLNDSQAGARQDRIFWASNREEAGHVIHAYHSAWLPSDLLDGKQRESLADGLMAASRHWSISLHTNKGLAGAEEPVREAARGAAINPAVADAFALLICAADGPPAYPGVAGHEPDIAHAEAEAKRVGAAIAALGRHVATSGSYCAESDYFEKDWQTSFWGVNARRLRGIKRAYDPGGLFRVHHGIGAS